MSEETADAKPLVTYTSNPIANYKIGPFKFEKATLHLYDQDSIDKFEKLLKSIPAGERSRIQKVDLEAAEAITRKILESQGKTTQEIDSTVGDRQPPPVKPVGSLNATLLKQQQAGQAAQNKQ